ncbi:zinc finger CCCH domain-containing protein 25 [Andrographis paniculata]|uniref:zinc finger CCCH domain-containing protein 25 n=1 Tax=Andrographis paniculata TaxID=175694 RepID=UPI0021E76999|nr:zinc finger CCCH domain-containing protein 25 [Andrographis paniculata]
MNPLTLVKRIQNINKKEASLGISEEASWHAKYKDSAYVYVGGVPYDLTEGDLLAVFAQYGEIVDVNLVRDKGTGKSKGFAFLAYEDQRSTNLAVDNLNGAQVLGRIIRVDHVNKYKKLEEEDEETRQQKREERGVCRAFQRGECNRGDSCKFSHNEQRAANTGWGAKEDKESNSRWGHDKFKDGRGGNKNSNKDSQYSRARGDETARDNRYREPQLDTRDDERRSGKKESDKGYYKPKDVRDASTTDKRTRQSYISPDAREEHDRRNEKKTRKYDDRHSRERDSRSSHHHHRGDRDGDDERNRSHRR